MDLSYIITPPGGRVARKLVPNTALDWNIILDISHCASRALSENSAPSFRSSVLQLENSVTPYSDTDTVLYNCTIYAFLCFNCQINLPQSACDTLYTVIIIII